jgi:hypothetical protein
MRPKGSWRLFKSAIRSGRDANLLKALPAIGWARVVCLALGIGLIGLGGCRTQDPSTPAVGTSTTQPARTNVESPDEKTVRIGSGSLVEATISPPPTRDDLEFVMWKIRCLLDSKKRKGAQAIYDRHGFRDAADWASKWSRASQSDPDWAERSLVSVLNRTCPAPD